MKYTGIGVDGSNLCYVCYFRCVKDQFSSESEMYGKMLLSILKDIEMLITDTNPNDLLVFWDCPKNYIRRLVFDQYKQHRKDIEQMKKHKDKINKLIKLVHQVFEALGIRQIAKDGLEADDLAYVYATQSQKRKEYESIYLVSTDKDWYQLVNDRTSIYNPVQNQFINYHDVLELTSLTPKQYVDFKILVGDASDNYPGVRGIGKKRAKMLLGTYGSINNILSIGTSQHGVTDKHVETVLNSIEIVKIGQKILDLSYLDDQYYNSKEIYKSLFERTYEYNQDKFIGLLSRYVDKDSLRAIPSTWLKIFQGV